MTVSRMFGWLCTLFLIGVFVFAFAINWH